MKRFKKLAWALLGLLLLVVLYFSFVFILGFATEYKPQLIENIEINSKSNLLVPEEKTEFSILSWNIGYCGLGAPEDFFYDGGKKTRPSKKDFEIYLQGVKDLLLKHQNVDFIFLQEVDWYAKRSYKYNQAESFENMLENFNSVFAKNYDVRFVPLPLHKPMGIVQSGMQTFSKYKIEHASRHGFDANFPWWKRLFLLKRCMIVSHLEFGEKDLVLINLHNSAFDPENLIKPIELQTIKEYAMAEYAKGNYVVIGGDWNQNPHNFNPDNYDKSWNIGFYDDALPNDLFPTGWTWMHNESTPSYRFVDEPYLKGKTFTTIFDFFVVSPNLEAVYIVNPKHEFSFSDHDPILFYFKIKTEEEEL